MFDNSPFKLIKLGDVVADKETRDPRRAPDWQFKYVDIASVNNKRFIICEPKSIRGADAPSRARKVVRVNEVIFATTRPYLKSVAIIPQNLDGQICSTGFCVLRPTSQIDHEWLFFCTISDQFMRQIIPLMRGANYPAVTDKDILGALIPLPPIDEQRRIVTRIKECMERVEEVEGLNLSIRKDATQLPMAFRYDLWETCSKQYSPQELGAVVSSTKNGLYKPAKYHGSGSILLRMFNINGAGFDNTKIVRMQVTSKEAEDYYICNGDIIVSRVNSRELVGKSCLVQGLNEAAVHEAMLIRLRVDERVVDQRFLVWLINSPQFLHDLRNRAKHAIGQSSINQKDLLTSKIPLPYLAHQKDLVSQNESFAPLAIAIQNEVAEQEKASLNLRESILRKAFAGEL